MSDCIFCKIANGEIPTTVVYEDDLVMAFEDANPQMPVHTLIVPKAHYANMNDDMPDELMGHLFNTVKKVAEIKGVAESGYRVIVNTGEDAQQVVKHLHIHVLGGAKMNEGSPAL
ncbi:histidine triad nucleotide-binding protein [Slackia heliotrinireducens]|jgi:histidine triad (HIT) family protein|uniref:HIT family hydrolase, diadenosine tetraphosphate hydrolase n=1 Tax=Slackia heliotrinireducens (strain ATCC 29202 / DSM 20476 / NCTC 11029 / RHS 1) TaxID=471855 RepID=C7N5R3_SLAHD|nr:histidine triad nucleotide-binding protein [Slackia heliotrinireducens]ACV22248.1 HIT family hydrolase, diadenosine tetraphosphate hydrolase [Slackia heliotrinireducens DSM 20476]VEH00397.1 HIT-like protein HI_0961 [Slackia heliotrinireducens]